MAGRGEKGPSTCNHEGGEEPAPDGALRNPAINTFGRRGTTLRERRRRIQPPLAAAGSDAEELGGR